MLFQKVRQDDLVAFEKLFKKLYPRLKDFAIKLVKETDIAEDIVQEVFIKVWEKRKQIATINIEAFFLVCFVTSVFHILSILRSLRM